MRYVSVPVRGRNVTPLLIIGVKTSGDHNYEHIPFGLLKDQTNKGPVWDVTKNFRGFWYTPSTGAISTAQGAGTGGTLQTLEGVNWLNFGGSWGDKKWPTSKFGQYCVGSECHIEDGPTGKNTQARHRRLRLSRTIIAHWLLFTPTGPLSKNLGRTAPCQDESSCTVQTGL